MCGSLCDNSSRVKYSGGERIEKIYRNLVAHDEKSEDYDLLIYVMGDYVGAYRLIP